MKSVRKLPWAFLGLSLSVGGLACDGPLRNSGPYANPDAPPISARVPVTTERVRAFCGDCHAYPPPESFPKTAWRNEVNRGYDFFAKSDKKYDAPDKEAVIDYYVERAPEALAIIAPTPESTPPVRFEKSTLKGPARGEPSAIANVRVARLTGAEGLDLLACDMAKGVLWTRPAGETGAQLKVLANDLANPCHIEVVDLDGDGLRDLLVADLGVVLPSDQRQGRVLWLRAKSTGEFETFVLANELGRVCDVQAADFDGDGDLDLVVAVFGWHKEGEVLLLENQGRTEEGPKFERKTIDPRHGTIHVPVADLDGDGRPDFVALISQEIEEVVVFHNDRDGKFTPKTLFQAEHPAFGSSGLELVDLDADGDLDVLMTNGDVYDSPLLKPYHGVAWMENQGADQPFVRHEIGPLYGAHRARAVDIDGDGDLDVVATAFLGEPMYNVMRKTSKADAIVLFEQVAPGTFTRHALETVSADYPSFDVADLDGDGRPDLVLGRYQDFRFAGLNWSYKDRARADLDPIVIWRNLGPATRGQ